jgi:hypothetical protein
MHLVLSYSWKLWFQKWNAQLYKREKSLIFYEESWSSSIPNLQQKLYSLGHSWFSLVNFNAKNTSIMLSNIVLVWLAKNAFISVIHMVCLSLFLLALEIISDDFSSTLGNFTNPTRKFLLTVLASALWKLKKLFIVTQSYRLWKTQTWGCGFSLNFR